MAVATWSGLVRTMSCQMEAGLEASRVVSRSPRPAQARPSAPAWPTDDVHQRADGQLREVADVRQNAVVLLGVHAPGNGAQTGDERFEVRSVSFGGLLGPGDDPRPAVEEVGARCLDAA